MRRLYPEISIALVFCIICSGIIFFGNGIPYVFDGNETFSSIVHAKNLLTFDLSQSMGLADESVSPIPAGHPVVHTHQGNFPRLFAATIYALGAETPEAQIIVTTFTIGLGSIVLLFRALRRHFATGYALAVIFLLMTNYVLFAQWQVVTYRVWNVAFLAAMLYVVAAHRDSGDKRWLVASYFVWLGLFYYELVFAVFSAVSIGLWVLWLHRKAIWGAVGLVASQLLGSISGAAIVIIQLIGYLGWDGFLKDLQLTYGARNAGDASTPEAMKALLRPFVEDNNIAFFYNIVDGSQHRSISFVIDALFKWGVASYTPVLAFIVVSLFCAALYSVYCPEKGFVRFPNVHVVAIAVMTFVSWGVGGSYLIFTAVAMIVAAYFLVSRWRPGEVQKVSWQYGAVILMGPMMALLQTGVFSGEMWLQHQPFSLLSSLTELLIVVAVSVGISVALVRVISATKGGLNLDQVFRTALGIVLLLAATRYQTSSAPGNLESVGIEGVVDIVGTGFQKLILLGIIALLAFWSLGPLSKRYDEASRSTVKEAFAFCLCFLGGFGAVVVLSPGYVYSGYVLRYAPFLFLPIALGTAVSFYWLALGTPWGRLRAAVADSSGARALWRRPDEWGAALGLAFLCVLWISVQIGYARTFTESSFSDLINALRRMPATTTIVSNSYAVPFGMVTGNWAYLDHGIGNGKVIRTKDGYNHEIYGEYVWFADRKTNKDYLRPSHFVCFIPRGTWTYHTFGAQEKYGCSDLGIVQLAQQKADGVWPDHKIVAQDNSGDGLWAIIELDKDHSPYLTAVPEVRFIKADKGYEIDLAYGYKQQDGRAESATSIGLFPILRNGDFCEITEDAIATTEGHEGTAALSISTIATDLPLIVVAQPFTTSRKGEVFFTSPYRLSNGKIWRDKACGTLRLLSGKILSAVWE